MNTLLLSATILGLTSFPLAGQSTTQSPTTPTIDEAPAAPGFRSAAMPVAPAPQSTMTRSGRVRSVMAGPDGTVQSLLLRDGSTVLLPPGSTQALRVHEGSLVHVTGQASGIGSSSQISAQTIRVGRQTYLFAAAISPGPALRAGESPVQLPAGDVPPPPPPPPPGGPVPPPPPPPAGANPLPPTAPGVTPLGPAGSGMTPLPPRVTAAAPQSVAPASTPGSAPVQSQPATATPQP